jgi:hypothetical protein
MTLEKDIEDVVVLWAKKHGFLAPKVKFAEAGWPDRLFISPLGHTIFIEFKRPGERPDALQEYRLEHLRKRSIPSYWTDNTIEGINILKAAVEPARLPDASNTVTPFPSRSGSVLGSGAGQDVNRPSGPEDLVGEGTDQKGVDSCATQTDVFGVAGRVAEVERLRGDDLPRSTRETEGSNACE